MAFHTSGAIDSVQRGKPKNPIGIHYVSGNDIKSSLSSSYLFVTYQTEIHFASRECLHPDHIRLISHPKKDQNIIESGYIKLIG